MEGTFTESSDQRFKTHIAPLGHTMDPLQVVHQLQGVSYVNRYGRSCVGFLAQNVQECLPQAVREDSEGNLSVAYGNMVALVAEALKQHVRECNRGKSDKESVNKCETVSERAIRAMQTLLAFLMFVFLLGVVAHTQ